MYNPFVEVHESARIGMGSLIGRYTTIYPRVNLGNDVIIGSYCEIGLSEGGELETIVGGSTRIRSFAIIYEGVHIGTGFKTGHRVLLRQRVRIGSNVVIGSDTEVADDAEIEDDVRVHSACKLFERTYIQRGARLGPGVYTLNTRYPYRPGQTPKLEGVTIGENARIGARVCLMPGIEIGKWALVGAGSLVTKDVPAYAVVYGNPAVVRGDIRDLKVKGTRDLAYRTG